MQMQQVSPGRDRPRKKTCLGINHRCEAVGRCLRLLPLAGTVTWRGQILGFIQGNFVRSDNKKKRIRWLMATSASRPDACWQRRRLRYFVMDVGRVCSSFSEKSARARLRLPGWRRTCGWSPACGSETRGTGLFWPDGTSTGPRWTRRTGTRKQVGGFFTVKSTVRECRCLMTSCDW